MSENSTRGEILWTPSPEYVAGTHLGRFLDFLEQSRGLTFSDYHALWRWSVEQLDDFWTAAWSFIEPVFDGDAVPVLHRRDMPGAEWFPNAQVNFAENTLTGPDAQVAIIARSQTVGERRWTRGELRDAVARAQAGLRRLGVGRGDRVAGYLPNIGEAVVALLATTSLGAIWSSCGPELGTQAVLDRFQQIEPKVLIAVDGYRYGEASIDRRSDVRRIRAGLPSLAHTVMVPYLFKGDGGLDWQDLLSASDGLAFERVPFAHPLWILYSSGTTGLPKAIVHGHGGIVAELGKAHMLQWDLGPGDRYFVYCSTTWVMWNIVVGGLLVGATIVLFDGNPAYPSSMTLWSVASETETSVYGTGASLLIANRREGLRPADKVDLSRLKSILSTGSPLPASGFRWVYEAVHPSVFLQSTSGGTDICGAFVGGSPMLPVRAGEIACRCLGVDARAAGPQGNTLYDEPGELAISEPMPSMPLFFWGDRDGARYRDTYFSHFPGEWRHGDWVTFHPDGACTISGRSDGTLNRGGVRMGTAEFYAVLDDPDTLPEVVDALVVHLEDPSGGVGSLLLFVCLDHGVELDEQLKSRIFSLLREKLSPRHRPDEIYAVPAVPYNLTGKRLEVPIKRILQGVPRAQALSEGAVRNPEAIDAFEALLSKC